MFATILAPGIMWNWRKGQGWHQLASGFAAGRENSPESASLIYFVAKTGRVKEAF